MKNETLKIWGSNLGFQYLHATVLMTVAELLCQGTLTLILKGESSLVMLSLLAPKPKSSNPINIGEVTRKGVKI